MFKAIVLPPVGVFLERGCVCDLWINIALTCLGYLPGITKYFDEGTKEALKKKKRILNIQCSI
jgi:uncharacterized membrane protein YqaE (UPF0057 family)